MTARRRRGALTRPRRESMTTINRDGSRLFLHPADVSGRYTIWRRIVALLLIAVYVMLPWVKVGGYPAVFLDVVQRRFHLFGLIYTDQDLWMVFFLITGLGFVLFFVTALFGRLWCGWACPQTVFLEHVYRRIERWIEGDAPKRKQLDQAPWNGEKVFKRVLKHSIFIVLSLVLAHVFLAYFISIEELYRWLRGNPLEHWGAFLFVVVASGIVYFNFSWFREQLCLIICPYGRLQSTLIDDDTVVIGYDEKRGEPRGPLRMNDIGDCIDCLRCVQVCPTGIDIRQGLQIECVGCSNCIDACDAIMDKVGRPRGLIRYDSHNGFQGKKGRLLRPRFFMYAFLLVAGAAAMTISSLRLSPVDLGVARMTGSPFFLTEDAIRNQYTVRIVNKHAQQRSFQLTAQAQGQPIEVRGDGELVLKSGEEIRRPLVVSIAREDYNGRFAVAIVVSDSADGTVLTQREVEFMGPSANWKPKEK